MALSKDALNHLADTIAEIATKRRDISFDSKQMSRSELESRHPLDRIAFYSHVFLDCHLFIVNEKAGEK